MLTLQTEIRVDGITGGEIFDFLADPSDRAYQQWWPGTHLQLHPLERHEGHIGDVIYMDEYVGRRRVRMTVIVIEAVRGERLVWQFKKLLRLPARLVLELADYEGGVAITHTIEAGFKGPGRVVDPLMRLFFSRRFAEAMDHHAKTEFPLLRDRLGDIKAGAAGS
ncbi:MAG: hypothetical protein K0S15_1566 [Solirubrobacterales bacterium]|jgi:hypothetical protein|nr:hypothetical protein [Solirubrobacterales bacterium]